VKVAGRLDAAEYAGHSWGRLEVLDATDRVSAPGLGGRSTVAAKVAGRPEREQARID